MGDTAPIVENLVLQLPKVCVPSVEEAYFGPPTRLSALLADDWFQQALKTVPTAKKTLKTSEFTSI
jgi:hypothetical protein